MLKEKSYDVIVVGAGFAGGIVAAKIAQEGLDPTNGERLKIALIESGPYFKGKPRWGYGIPSRRQLFTHIPQDMRQRASAARRAPGGWWTHIGVGGGSLMWGAKGNPPDDNDYEWWARETGVDWTRESMKPAVDELLRIWNSHTIPDKLLQEYHFRFRDVAQSMGYKTEKILVHRKNCIMCGSLYEAQPQCRYDAKMSTLLSHIPAAEDHGVEIVPHTKVEQVIIEKRGAQWAATGVWYREKDAPAQKAEAKKIILASGASTVSLLYASGYGPRDLLGDQLIVENPNVGSHIEGHPRAMLGGVTARFKDLIVHEPGDGNSGFWFLDDKDSQGGERLFVFSGSDSQSSGFWGAHTYALSEWAPEFGHKHKAWMRDNWKVWRHIAGGSFRGPLVIYSHSSAPKGRILPDESLEFDQEHPIIKKRRKESLDLLRSLFEKMGAQEIRGDTEGDGSLRPGMIHEVGGCRAGADRKNSVVNSNFESHDIANLFIVDSMTHPRVTSLFSGGAVVAVVGTFAAQRMIKNYFRRSQI
ncbi:MAG: GMC family oxidoreductase [Acidobacteria bacterium]|nr:GMC family oxidoreductase [Acidobacteriota bacterium]